MNQKFLIVIGGPTASGKSVFAIRTAIHFRTEIISADSRQFYREMQIGTAKPTRQELSMVKHHFIDRLSIFDPYSVGDFERDALDCLRQIFEVHDVAVMTGGSGLYIRAVCEGLDVFPEVPPSIRDEVEALWASKGIEALQAELSISDPEYYREVDLQNPARLIRALSVCRASGQPFSFYRKGGTGGRFFTPIYIQMEWPREELYRRINERVDDMMKAGLADEARGLFPHRHLQALQTVGYQELFEYFDGNCSLESAVERIRRHSRNYAKRQLTWMRRYGHWHAFHPGKWTECMEFVQHEMNKLPL